MAQKKAWSSDYSIYVMDLRERVISLFIASAILFAIGYLFYKHVLIAGCFALFALRYPKMRAGQKIRRRKREFVYQFKTSLYALSAALSSGKSIENSFIEIVEDVKLLYGEQQLDIIREIEAINQKVRNGMPVEQAVADMSRRIDVEDVANFSEVFQSCKRTGGDLIEVIGRTSQMIGEKIEIHQEIDILIAQKKFENRILTVMPFIIIAFITFSSPDYSEPLYHGLGRMIMTFSLLILGACYWLSNKMIRIRI